MLTAEVAELLPYLTEAERAEMGKLLATDDAAWRPLPGPQSDAYHSAADIVGYGGAAGGGKTDLACGLALMKHQKSAIFRREATQLTAVVDRLSELVGSRDGYNGQEKIWRLPSGRQIEFGSCPHPGDETRHQGRPKDLLVLDEATNLLESQARFLMGWVRTTKQGQRCRVLLTFNPPTSAEGQWIIAFFAPWLDRKHPNPANPGELRWFASIGGNDVEVPDARPFILSTEGARQYEFRESDQRPDQIIRPQSRTFIPSRVADNPFLVGTGYLSTLQALPEPLRSQMLQGDFAAGMEDDRWQVIPTAWVDAAMARWKPKDAKGDMDSLGVDVARGGRDSTIISRRHGTWFDDLLAYPGLESPDGPTVAGYVIQARRDRSPAHIDVIGWGSSPYDFLQENGVQTVPINGANRTDEKSEDGTIGFANMRAQLWWRMREALDPLNADPIALPNDTALKADLCAPRWRMTVSGVQIEAKDDVIKRIGRSPDRGDAVCMALIATRKATTRERRPERVGGWMGG
jgi:hypothetical protein